MFNFDLLKTVVTDKMQNEGYKVLTRFVEDGINTLYFTLLKDNESISIAVDVTDSNYGIRIEGGKEKEQYIFNFIETNIRMMIISSIKSIAKTTRLPIWEYIEENQTKMVCQSLLRYREQGQTQEEERNITTLLTSKYSTSVVKKKPVRAFIEKQVIKNLPIGKKEIVVAILYTIKAPTGYLYSIVIVDKNDEMYLYNYYAQMYNGLTYVMVGLEDGAEVVPVE